MHQPPNRLLIDHNMVSILFRKCQNDVGASGNVGDQACLQSELQKVERLLAEVAQSLLEIGREWGYILSQLVGYAIKSGFVLVA